MNQSETTAPPIPTVSKAINTMRWSAVALLVIGGVVNYLDRSTLSIANTTIAKEFGLDAVAMGLLLSAFSWPYAIAQSARMGWMPSYPTFDRNPLDLSDDAAAAGKPVGEYVVEQLKSGDQTDQHLVAFTHLAGVFRLVGVVFVKK